MAKKDFMIEQFILQVDQSISHHDMYDYLHLTQKGYTKVNLSSTVFEPYKTRIAKKTAFLQCCGSGMFIPDTGSDFFSIPDAHQRI